MLTWQVVAVKKCTVALQILSTIMLWTTRESQSLEELQAEEYLSKLSQPQTVKSLPVEVRKVESALSEERRWSMSSPPAYVKECSSLRDRTLHLQEIYSNLSNSEFISPLSNEMISQQQRDSKIRCTIFAWQRHSTNCQKKQSYTSHMLFAV